MDDGKMDLLEAMEEVEVETKPVDVPVVKGKIKVGGNEYFQFSVRIPRNFAEKFGLKGGEKMTATYTPPTLRDEYATLQLIIKKRKRMKASQKELIGELDAKE